MRRMAWDHRGPILLHLTALEVLVIGMYAATLRRDPELVREVVDEGLSHVENASTADKRVVRGIIDGLLGSIAQACGVTCRFWFI